MTVPVEEEEELKKKFGVVDWNRPDEEYTTIPSRRQPFRAIVKELLTKDVPFNDKSARKILKDLKRIRALDVYPIDIQARNYKSGLLVDLSIAMTKPHYLFNIKPRRRVKFYQREDLRCFESMIEDEKVDTWVRALRNDEYCAKLRSEPRKTMASNTEIAPPSSKPKAGKIRRTQATERPRLPPAESKSVKAAQPRKRGRKARNSKPTA